MLVPEQKTKNEVKLRVRVASHYHPIVLFFFFVFFFCTIFLGVFILLLLFFALLFLLTLTQRTSSFFTDITVFITLQRRLLAVVGCLAMNAFKNLIMM